MKASGTHLLAEFDNCESRLLGDVEQLSSVLERSIAGAGLSLVSSHSHLYEPVGITLVCIISESHVVLHTFPEAQHVSVDIFTCAGASEKTAALLSLLERELTADRKRTIEVQRGELLEVKEANTVSLCQHDGMSISIPFEKKIYSGRSEYQQIEVLRSAHFGKMLVVDNSLSFYETDSERYRQEICKPFRGSAIDSLLLVGCATLKLSSFLDTIGAKELSFWEQDPEVFSVIREFFPTLHQELTADGARSYQEQVVSDKSSVELQHDAAIIDISLHPAAFTCENREVYLRDLLASISASVKPGGRICIRCGSAYASETVELLRRILDSSFSDVSFWSAQVPVSAGDTVFASAVVEKSWEK